MVTGPDGGPQSLLTPASLISLRVLNEESAWIEHIPFAGWLVDATRPRRLVELGTHTGVSYFAFCEAVLQVNADTECFAIDHWRGDEHSGHYGEEVYEEVRRLNDRYAAFSKLIRMTFDDATAEFDDGSIDLLHIDGMHTYQAVAHDFETWLPKLSDRAVVVFHDTNERHDDFGVFRLFQELSERHPSFEFTHGHGLGVVAVGDRAPETIRVLTGLDAEGTRTVRDLYKALGRRFTLQIELERTRRDLEARATSALGAEVEADRLSEQLELAMTDLEASSEQLDDARSELAAALDIRRTHDEELGNLKGTIGYLNSRNAELVGLLEAAEARVAQFESSSIWRATAPIRFLADKAKAGLGKIRPRPARALDDQPALPYIERLYLTFDDALDRRTRRQYHAYRERHPELANVLASVVMPTYNRASRIGEAIASVQVQDHRNWELLIVDDGSTDDTESVVTELAVTDSRIHYVKTERHGVGAARNAALDLARGEVIAYLDSDNAWSDQYLSTMVAALDRSGATVAYSAVRLVQHGEPAGFRGDVFSYEACLEANYIDINALSHTREPVDRDIRFDPQIRRTNDWDFILTITYGQPVTYVPFVGADYTLESRDDQISSSEPFVFRNIVGDRHRARFESDEPLETFEEVLKRKSLSIAIRIAPLYVNRLSWGDFHFAVGLQQALERLGHWGRIYFRDQEVQPRVHDMVVSLRGLAEFEPVPEAVNVIWSISHPDQVSFEEMEGFDIVLLASETYQRMLTRVVGMEASALRQATDRARFFPQGIEDHDGTLLFVGNSRDVQRPSVRLALEHDLPLTLHGAGWEKLVPEGTVASHYLPNEAATLAYARAAAVLNDHWESMRDFGYISNRIYDVLASGGRVVTDTFPELERELGDVIETWSTPAEFLERAQEALASTGNNDLRHRAALEVLAHHTFDSRAERIVAEVHRFLGGAVEEPEPALPRQRRIRVGVVPQMPRGKQWTSSAYLRLMLPLTSDLSDVLPQVQVFAPSDIEEASTAGLDCLVVSRTAIKTAEEAKSLVAKLADAGVALIVDTDDAFHQMDRSHPEFADYRSQLEAYDVLLDNAEEVWCSTERLKVTLDSRLARPAVVIPNSIDPRLWRRYRYRGRETHLSGRLELLYFGTTTHQPDLEIILEALDRLGRKYRNSFALTLIGVTSKAPQRDWIREAPPTPSTYPAFARAMRDMAPQFDVGLAPLVANPFNELKSDIKVLEYTAMGLPVLASPVGPYADVDFVDHCPTAEDWARTLVTLIDHPGELHSRWARLEEVEQGMWRQRSAAGAGTRIMERVTSIVG